MFACIPYFSRLGYCMQENALLKIFRKDNEYLVGCTNGKENRGERRDSVTKLISKGISDSCF